MTILDQAEGLRRLLAPRLPRLPRLLVLASCGAQSGRTTLAVNLAVALRQEGLRVVLIDGNRGIGNVCDALGLRSRFELAHALQGDCAMRDVIVPGPEGAAVLPAARGLRLLRPGGQADGAAVARLARFLGGADAILVDAEPGDAAPPPLPVRTRSAAVITTSADGDAVTRTYAWLKRSAARHPWREAQVVVCRARSDDDARTVFDNLHGVAARYLDARLHFLGALCEDASVRRAARERVPVLCRFPAARSSAQLRAIAARGAALAA